MPAHRSRPQGTFCARRRVGAAMSDRNLNWPNGIRMRACRRHRARIGRRRSRASHRGRAIVFGAAAGVTQLPVGGEKFSQISVPNTGRSSVGVEGPQLVAKGVRDLRRCGRACHAQHCVGIGMSSHPPSPRRNSIHCMLPGPAAGGVDPSPRGPGCAVTSRTAQFHRATAGGGARAGRGRDAASGADAQ
jgi:hypothetical protein